MIRIINICNKKLSWSITPAHRKRSFLFEHYWSSPPLWYNVERNSVIFHTVWGHYKAPYVERTSIHHSISWISVTVAAKLPRPIWLNAFEFYFCRLCWSQGQRNKLFWKWTAHNIHNSIANILLIVNHQDSQYVHFRLCILLVCTWAEKTVWIFHH